MIEKLKKRRYRKEATLWLAFIFLTILKRANDVYPAELINWSAGYSYYFFAKKGELE